MITRIISLLLLITLLKIDSIKAQTSENALLWEITGNNLQEPSYIFGILKFIPEKDYYFPPYVEEKFKSSKILATETQLDHHARHELNKAAHLEHHESLSDYLSEEEMERLKRIFHDELNVSELKFNLVYKKFKPIMLSTTMPRLAIAEHIKYYELELIRMANEQDKAIVALESVESEVDALEKIKLKDQLSALKETIDNFEKQLDDYKKLVSVYKQGDLHETLEYSMHPAEIHDDYEKYFVFARNYNWIPRMENYMKEGSTFFAVGASHLSEEEGLLNLLQNKGFTIKPVEAIH